MNARFDIKELSPIQRIILTMNGTLTNVLEVLLLENLFVVKLFEKQCILEEDMPVIDILKGTEIIERKILLKGAESRKNWLYAHSILVSSRLDEDFRELLLHSEIPIGRLWVQQKVEIFQELVDCFSEQANELSGYFAIQPHEELLCRTYKVFSHSQPVILITEKFPKSYYC